MLISSVRSYQDIASSHSVSTLSKTNIIPQVMVEGRLPPKVKRDAHDVILEFIRSRPPLKPVRREQRALFVMRLEIEPGPDTAPWAEFLSLVNQNVILAICFNILS